MKIYHNPRCRKSRETLALLQDREMEPDIVLYLEDTPTIAELKAVISQLGIRPFDLVRKGEKIYKEQFRGKDLTDEEWLQVLHDNPKLIERPIVITENGAAIGRPPERVLEIL